MAVEERRRIALHRAAAETWGEEVADTLVELVAPPGEDPASRRDIEEVLSAVAASEQRLSATFERRISDAVSMQTRTLVFSQLGALVVIAALAFGLR
jgi:hypothetical protein